MYYQYTTERSPYFYITPTVVSVLRKYEENLQYTKTYYNTQKQEIHCFVIENAKLILRKKSTEKSMCTNNILLSFLYFYITSIVVFDLEKEEENLQYIERGYSLLCKLKMQN